MNRTLLLILLVILAFALLPAWPYSAAWGYYPSGGVGLDYSHPSADTPAPALSSTNVFGGEEALRKRDFADL